MLKFNRIDKAIDDLSIIRNSFKENWTKKNLNLEEVDLLEKKEIEFKNKHIKDLVKLVTQSSRIDPDTEDFVYKEDFRNKIKELEEKAKPIIDASSEIIQKIKEAKIFLKKKHDIEVENKRLNKLKIEKDKLEAKEKAKREKVKQKQLKAEQEEKEREELMAKLILKRKEGSKETKLFLSLKARVDDFISEVKKSTKTTSISEELELALNLLPSSLKQKKNLLKLMIRFYENIIQHPDKVEYRKFNLENEKFQRDVLNISGSLEIFVCGGFELSLSEVFDEENKEIIKKLSLMLEEPEVTNYDAWKSWFDTQKTILETLKRIKV